MPVVDADLHTAEILVSGTIVSKGSTAVKTVNVFHYRRTATAIPVHKLNLCNVFDNTVGLAMTAAMNLGWTLDNTQVRFLEDPTDAYFLLANGIPGVITGDRFPPHVSAYLYMKTALRGRNYMGSKHFGPMSESDTSAATADIWNAGALGRLTDIATAIQAGLASAEGNNYVPCVVSKRLSDFSVTPCNIVSADVISILVNQRVGSMIRRKVKTLY